MRGLLPLAVSSPPKTNKQCECQAQQKKGNCCQGGANKNEPPRPAGIPDSWSESVIANMTVLVDMGIIAMMVAVFSCLASLFVGVVETVVTWQSRQ